VDILYDPRDPSHVMLDSWGAYILCTTLLSGWLGIIIVDRIHKRDDTPDAAIVEILPVSCRMA
jgi:hypothetical protein